MAEFLNANTFAKMLDQTMKDKNLSHIDGIIEICRMRELDVETVPDLLTPKLKKQVHAEALILNMVKARKVK